MNLFDLLKSINDKKRSLADKDRENRFYNQLLSLVDILKSDRKLKRIISSRNLTSAFGDRKSMYVGVRSEANQITIFCKLHSSFCLGLEKLNNDPFQAIKHYFGQDTVDHIKSRNIDIVLTPKGFAKGFIDIIIKN